MGNRAIFFLIGGWLLLFIRNCLTDFRHLTVVYPSETIANVLKKMEGHLSLPCIAEDHTFIGMVSKRTIFEGFQAAYEASQSYESYLGTSVASRIETSIVSLTQDSLFEETIEIITRHPFVPIVENGKLIGIVKRSDIQHALSVVFATSIESDRLLLGVAEVEGAFERLFNITHKLGLNVVTCVPFDASKNPLNRRVILKVAKSAKLKVLIEFLERAGFLVVSVN
jgi:CBS domain-containing protein